MRALELSWAIVLSPMIASRYAGWKQFLVLKYRSGDGSCSEALAERLALAKDGVERYCPEASTELWEVLERTGWIGARKWLERLWGIGAHLPEQRKGGKASCDR